MTDFFVPELDPLHPHRHLDALDTPFGKRSVYDSVSYCTRCGSCQQACPTYLITAQETFSPRGRNQLVRLAAEGKLNLKKNRVLAEKALNTCLLCGRCTQACAGKIPTAEHMLELRRTLQSRALPRLLFGLLSLHGSHPRLFSALVKTGLWLRRLGVVTLMRLGGLTRLTGLRWMNHANDILPNAPDRQQRTAWKQACTQTPPAPTLIYLPSLEADFLMPAAALSTLRLAEQTKHRVQVWSHTASGLFEYVYGDIRQSRRLLRRLITRRAQTAGGTLPLLTDSIDVYLFLRRAPQLFTAWPRWREKAEALAKSVWFITDIWPRTRPPSAETAARVRLDASALFAREGEPFDKARKILKTQFKKNFVECLYKDADIPAFGYSFVRDNLGKEVCFSVVRNIARTQTKTVFTLSGLSALELNFYLKRFYPHAQADHLACLNG